MGGGNVKREGGSGELRFGPVARLKSIGKLLAIDSNLPGKQTVSLKHVASEFRGRGGVNPGKRRERELAVMIELNKFVVLVIGALRSRLRIGYVLDQKLPVGLEKRLHFPRKRIHCFAGNQALGVLAPAKGGRKSKQKDQEQKGNSSARAEERRTFHGMSLFTAAIPAIFPRRGRCAYGHRNGKRKGRSQAMRRIESNS